MMTGIKYIGVMICLLTFAGCTISLNGASIPEEMKTVNIIVFENNAPLVVPSLSSQFTEELKTRIRNQTRLSITPNDAHAVFSGNITGYSISPVAITDNKAPTAGANRLSITVNVKYVSNLNPKASFEKSFERYKDFKLSGGSFQAQEAGLIKDVTAQLTEDIFNAAFAQW
ncbi:MAG TPA: LptE family protein [Pedobacter sp.]|nr:LptE family protein [Pedobacter sp.]